MNAFLTKAVLGAALAATSLTAAVPAEAQRYRESHGGDAGVAIIAGIAGLAIGAAIASGNNNHNRYYREQPYQYNSPNYNQYNDDRRYNSYNNDNGYNYQNCRIEKRYDPYQDRNVRVRVCY